MKKALIAIAVVGAAAAIAYSIPPVRRQIHSAKDRFQQAYRQRESDLRAALLADEERQSKARHRMEEMKIRQGDDLDEMF